MADFDPTDYDGHADDPLAVLEGQEIDELGGKGPQVSSWWNFFVGNWASHICFFWDGFVPICESKGSYHITGHHELGL